MTTSLFYFMKTNKPFYLEIDGKKKKKEILNYPQIQDITFKYIQKWVELSFSSDMYVYGI